MLQVLLLASVALLCHGTPRVDYYRPAIYDAPAPITLQPAPLTYITPIAVKEAPKPYSFGYNAPAIGGGSSRHETSDGNGRVVGSYTVTDADGRARVVDYYADETGFHANVQTNEPGTANENPADVSVQSYAAPAVSPVVSPKVISAPEIVAPTRYVAPAIVAPTRYVAPAPVYTVRAPIRRIQRPLQYRIVPVHDAISYAPEAYASYSPYKLAYYK